MTASFYFKPRYGLTLSLHLRNTTLVWKPRVVRFPGHSWTFLWLDVVFDITDYGI
jgi:hypothetical protein